MARWPRCRPASSTCRACTSATRARPSPPCRACRCTCPPGQTLGLVGPTGAGKSTLLKLLLRQWTPQQGGIRWGPWPLTDYTLAALRAGIAWVPQEAFLFSATVAENIALARPGASRAEIEAVARQAAVHDDIERLPAGLRHPGGRARRDALGRPAPARGDRARAAGRRALAAARRRALGRGYRHRGAASWPRCATQRQGRTVIIASHRLSTAARRRPDRGAAPRPGHRARQPRAIWWHRTAGTPRNGAVQQLEASLDAE